MTERTLEERVKFLEKTLEELCLVLELLSIEMGIREEVWLAPRLARANEPGAMVA